jgi:hypothetical protein
MNAISYVLPFRYSTGLMTTSWFAGASGLGVHAQSVFDFGYSGYIFNAGGKPIEIFNKTEMILNLALPLIFSMGFASMAIKWFKWT